ncbi:MAG: PSD1 and planctomycete cytochrome C domain-containing protein [Planctomycetota bacterium]|nr:PSD1 and planctomycete cytochrome C domain-containing protein [Planctomycetota bacterium]
MIIQLGQFSALMAAMLVWSQVSLPSAVAFDDPAADVLREIFFETDIVPLLEAHCLKCHGGEKLEGGLDLRRRFTIVKGGDSGTALSIGKPGESLLLEKIESGEMPPPDEEPLDKEKKQLLREWILGGAKLKNETELPLEESDAAKRVTAEDRAFWSFQSPVKLPIPTVMHIGQVRTPIDAFLLAKLEEKGLTFQGDASRESQVRRLYFDLTGLPPTPAQLAEFLSDESPNAYEQLVDRLLASPHYGERWGRHWLDIAGHADSDGYLAADRVRPEAWRYRDYVIRAHNDDLPYDQFVTEQLAGDELSDWRRADELTSEMIRQMTATGFLRTASDPTYPSYIEDNEVQQVMSDTMQIVGTTFLGLTIHCAKCHQHKFDPLSQRDYYSLQAILLPALDPKLDRWKPSIERGIPLATEAEQARKKQMSERAEARIVELNAAIADVGGRFRKKRANEHLAESINAIDATVREKVLAAVVTAEAQRNDEQKSLIAQYLPEVGLADDELKQRYAEYLTELAPLNAALAAEQSIKSHSSVVLLRGLQDLEGPISEGHVLIRGDHTKPGAVVQADVPEVLAPAGFEFSPEESYKTSGRRKAFAEWLTARENPLTARVQINRMWAHHFGRGIVSTRANFGITGARPTHPELLDWLAVEFMDSGWSMKAMHRLIVTSNVYRQSSAVTPALTAADPDNILLGAWPPRRHEGEMIRDSMLAVSGLMNEQFFGTPVPVQQLGDGSVITADDAQGHRRSVYLIIRRSQHLTMFDLFDTPMMEVNCPERTTSIVPLQALAMWHGPFAERAAQALADRLIQSSDEDPERIQTAYQLLFSRTANPHEVKTLQEFITSATTQLQSDLGSAATPEARYAASRTAWEQAALVLLNSNEFLYID